MSTTAGEPQRVRARDITPGQAAYEAAHTDMDGIVEWEFLPPEAHARWARIAQAAIYARFGRQ